MQAPHQQQDAEQAVHSDAQQGLAVEAGQQASEAQALTQQVSRRWFEESHYRRDQDAIEFRCVEQDALFEHLGLRVAFGALRPKPR
jgi:hypothetical protein